VLARLLLQRSHAVLVYSTKLGLVATEMAEMGLTVVDNLSVLHTPPDVIHGQHQHDDFAAMLHFSGTPIVHCVHGVLPWLEKPLPDLSCIHLL
jgi:hypothetical protein